jgi:hypothetical protein
MTDRIKGVYVAFDSDIRDDDAEPIIEAIKQIRHVQGVKAFVTEPADYFARTRVRAEIATKLVNILKED